MSEFAMEARVDPYKNFKFKVKWEGKYVAGVSKVSGLRRTTEVIEHREGGNPNSVRKSAGRTKFEPITLERGVTQDASFEDWANRVMTAGGNPQGDFRKDITIDFFNEAGQRVLSYKVYRCWVSEYQAMPDLNANGTSVAIEQIKLECEGWERDLSVVAPAAPPLST